MVNVAVRSLYGNQRALPLIFPVSIVYFSLHVLLPATVAFDSSFARVDLKAAFSFSYTAAPLLYRSSPVISSLPPFPFFRLSSFYQRIRAGMASPQLCSTFSFYLHNVLRRVLTRESMSLITFPHTRLRLIRARIYPTCQLQYTWRASYYGVDVRDLFVNL